MSVLGWHWETTVNGSTLDEIEENAQAVMRAFFGGSARDYVMEIEPAETMTVRDGKGDVYRYEVATYTARVRVTYTNYEAQK